MAACGMLPLSKAGQIASFMVAMPAPYGVGLATDVTFVLLFFSNGAS
jgi:hypothetical protein